MYKFYHYAKMLNKIINGKYTIIVVRMNSHTLSNVTLTCSMGNDLCIEGQCWVRIIWLSWNWVTLYAEKKKYQKRKDKSNIQDTLNCWFVQMVKTKQLSIRKEKKNSYGTCLLSSVTCHLSPVACHLPYLAYFLSYAS